MSDFFQLWVRPRATMKAILKQKPSEGKILFLFLIPLLLWIGLDIGINLWVITQTPESQFLRDNILFGLAIYGGISLISLPLFYATTWFTAWLCRLIFKTKSTARDCRIAMAWSTVSMSLMILPILLILILCNVFLIAADLYALIIPFLLVAILLYTATIVWICCIMYAATAQALGLPSAWQAFGLQMIVSIILILGFFLMLVILYFTLEVLASKIPSIISFF